jgi:hypothetical protein
MGKDNFKIRGVDPKSPITLELPEVEPVNVSSQNQTAGNEA